MEWWYIPVIFLAFISHGLLQYVMSKTWSEYNKTKG